MMKKFTILALSFLCMTCIETMAQKHDQFANFKRYDQANKELPAPAKKEKRVIFLGNSITEGWVNIHPEFFKENGYVGRGISGQTSYQFLLRFREDVINLKPKLVIINAGTNDIAENTDFRNQCPYQYDAHGSVNDIIKHGMKLLAKTLQHAVHGGIQIHNGNERCEDTDEFCCFHAIINGESQRLGKANKDA